MPKSVGPASVPHTSSGSQECVENNPGGTPASKHRALVLPTSVGPVSRNRGDTHYSPEEDGNSANGDDPSEELVAIDEDELQDLHDEAQETAPPVVVPENAPAIDAVPENEPADDAVPEAEPAADVQPQNDTGTAEEAAVIDNAKVAREMRKLSSGGGPPSHVQW